MKTLKQSKRKIEILNFCVEIIKLLVVFHQMPLPQDDFRPKKSNIISSVVPRISYRNYTFCPERPCISPLVRKAKMFLRVEIDVCPPLQSALRTICWFCYPSCPLHVFMLMLFLHYFHVLFRVLFTTAYSDFTQNFSL